MVTWGWSMNTSEGVKFARYRGDMWWYLKYWSIECRANYCNVEYWMKYCGIEILDEKPQFHQQDRPFRSCSSAPQSFRFLGLRSFAHLKRLPPEQKLWKPCVKNTLKVFYKRLCSSIIFIKEFHFGSNNKSFPYSNTSSEDNKEVHPENPFWRFYLFPGQASF